MHKLLYFGLTLAILATTTLLLYVGVVADQIIPTSSFSVELWLLVISLVSSEVALMCAE